MSRHVLTRSAPGPDETVGYGPLPEQVVDVRGGGPRAVVLLHGGFWRPAYDRTHLGPMASALAAAGLHVLVPEYRRVGWPGLFDDVAAGVAAAVRLAGGRAVLAGHSAGGQLAVWAALRTPGVTGVLSLAGCLDLALCERLDLDGGAVRALLGGAAGDVPERYAATDPAVLPLPAAAVRLLHGTADERVPVEVSRSYAARGVPLRELPGAGHFAVIDPLSREWSAVREELTALVGEG